jgi:hypothetical protein
MSNSILVGFRNTDQIMGFRNKISIYLFKLKEKIVTTLETPILTPPAFGFVFFREALRKKRRTSPGIVFDSTTPNSTMSRFIQISFSLTLLNNRLCCSSNTQNYLRVA